MEARLSEAEADRQEMAGRLEQRERMLRALQEENTRLQAAAHQVGPSHTVFTQGG